MDYPLYIIFIVNIYCYCLLSDSSENKRQIPVEPPYFGELNKKEKKKQVKTGETRCFIKFLFTSLEPIPHWAQWIINATLADAASNPFIQYGRRRSIVEAVPQQTFWLHPVNIHMAVQVVIWAEEYLWPLHLSVQFAVHLAHVVLKPASSDKDRLFCLPSSNPPFYTQHFPRAVPSSPN